MSIDHHRVYAPLGEDGLERAAHAVQVTHRQLPRLGALPLGLHGRDHLGSTRLVAVVGQHHIRALLGETAADGLAYPTAASDYKHRTFGKVLA